MLRIGLSVAALWLIVDQATKWWILNQIMNPPTVIPITSFFNLVLGYNTGVSFGVLAGVPAWVLLLVGIAAVSALLIWMVLAEDRNTTIALGLIIGGAAGNLVDRYRQGAVTDFLDFYVGSWHWPAFNMADVGIVSGVGILLLNALVPAKATGKPRR